MMGRARWNSHPERPGIREFANGLGVGTDLCQGDGVQVLRGRGFAIRSARFQQELRDLPGQRRSVSPECRSTTIAARSAASFSQPRSINSRKTILSVTSITISICSLILISRRRPRHNAAIVTRLLAQAKPTRILDYGGGNGKLADLLRGNGFSDVTTYDPYVPRFDQKPDGQFDCVICFEVIEHSTEPARTLFDITSMLTDSGIILLSTLLQPDDIDSQGLAWWYAAPRNAHVSLYSAASLEALARRAGFQVHSLDQSYHLFYRHNAALMSEPD